MPAVKKIKPINFVTNRNLILSALAVYTVKVQGYSTEKYLESPEKNNEKIRYELSVLKSKFHQEFKTDCEDVINNNILLVMGKIEEQVDFSQKDVSKLIKIYDDYIATLEKSDRQPVKLAYTSAIEAAFRSILSITDKSKKNSQWFYKGFIYEVQGHYTEDEIKLLILEDFDKERKMFEKLRAKFDDASSEDLKYERPRIPEKVRIEVWRRDGGKCARCGSREKLEYDHIVPISKGGSNTARNIELLCEKHNRSKSNNVV